MVPDPEIAQDGPPARGRLRDFKESRELAYMVTILVVGGQVWLATALGLGFAWLLPLATAVLMVASVMATRVPPTRRNWAWRALPLAVVTILALENAICLALLIHGIFVHSRLDPLGLVIAGTVLWVVNIGVFALAFWEIDGGGPEFRREHDTWTYDLVFPQQSNPPKLAPAGWKPAFHDYLYVSVTAATAFSPTDAMPYSGKAKLLMGLESTLSFLVVALLIARAVSIANG